jgi:lipid II:glycine glycyltransferase (peptidoglycan interpeptide bridge formation enzyme)
MNKLLSIFTDSENNLFQSEVWEEYEDALGNKTFRVSCDEGSALLVKTPLYKDKSYLYCPRGPMCTKEGWYVFLRKAREIAAKENCVFVRVEPYSLPNGIVKVLKFRKVGKYSPLSRQFSPMDTQILDLSKRDDTLLEEMKPKWRYNIKLAYRKGVTVRTSTNLADLKKFHEMSMNMKERGYTPFGLTHYERLLFALSKGKHVKLFIAEYQKQPLSMLLVTQYGQVATYLHGTSSDDYRELMPNHVAQWEAILDAQRQGCLVYDFWGVAPEGAENHGWAGITRFKTGFGGETIHFVGAFDYAFSPLWYNMLYAANMLSKIVKK